MCIGLHEFTSPPTVHKGPRLYSRQHLLVSREAGFSIGFCTCVSSLAIFLRLPAPFSERAGSDLGPVSLSF